jgi:hypothetical protein
VGHARRPPQVHAGAEVLVAAQRPGHDLAAGITDQGEGSARGGVILGIIGVVVGLLVVTAWIVLVALGVDLEELRRDLERQSSS